MDNSFWKCATIARQNWHLIDVAIWPLQLALHLFRKLSGLSLRESDRCLFCAVSMARSLSTSWGRKGRKGCTGQVLLAAVAAVAGSILSAPRSFGTFDHLWRDLIDSPQNWEDFRVDKPRGNPKFPDFKRRMGDKESLWLNSAPDSWLQYQEEKSQRNYVQDSTRSFWASVGFSSRTLLGFALKLLYSLHRTLRDSPGRIGLSHKLALE